MQVKVLYDKYSNLINTATLIFEEELGNKEVKLEIEPITETIDEEPITREVIKISFIDTDSTTIEHIFEKEDLQTLFNLLTNLTRQLQKK